MADIFLSYSREDEARAKNLVSEFEARGWSVFWDRRIPAGQTWRTHIGSALQNARCVVVTWSKHSVESQWVCEEADEGKARGVLLPILLDPVQPPRGFREIQAADLCQWQPGQASERLAELLGDLQRMLGGQRAATPAKPTAAERVATRPDPAAPAPRSPNRALVIGGALVGVALLAFVLFRFLAGGRSATQEQRAAMQDSMQEAEAHRDEVQQEALDDAKALREKASQGDPPQSEVSQPGGGTAASATEREWLVIAGSFRPGERKRAFQARDILARAQIKADVVESNDYPLLAPGLVITMVGPFESRAAANSALTLVRRTIPDAYVKKGREYRGAPGA
jgi:hypothetical protein